MRVAFDRHTNESRVQIIEINVDQRVKHDSKIFAGMHTLKGVDFVFTPSKWYSLPDHGTYDFSIKKAKMFSWEDVENTLREYIEGWEDADTIKIPNLREVIKS